MVKMVEFVILRWLSLQVCREMVFGRLCFTVEIRLEQVVVEESLNGGVCGWMVFPVMNFRQVVMVYDSGW